MKKTQISKPNSQTFKEYYSIIVNNHSTHCYSETCRLLNHYRDYLQDQSPTPMNLTEYFVRYRDLKQNTRCRYYWTFVGFFKWFSGESLPFKLDKAKIDPQFVSNAEINIIKQSILNKATHKEKAKRDLLILDTLAMTGLRCGELVNLKVRDLHFYDGKSLLVVKNGKGFKDRTIPLNPTISKRIQEYITEQKITDEVFSMKVQTLTNKIKVWSTKAGVPQIHAHSFRHKFATDLLQKGANIRVVQDLLGHSSLYSTERYLAVTDPNRVWAVGLLDGSSQGIENIEK